MNERRQLSLPEGVCAAAEKQFSSFGSLEDLLEFVLRELTRNDAEALDRAEQALLEERLRSLGYL